MRVLVIGGTRFIGRATVRLLVARGHDVTVFHCGQSETELASSLQHIHGDRANIASYRSEFENVRPHVVIDMCAMTEEDASELVRTFRSATERLVMISSQDVYRAYGVFHETESGPLESTPSDEDSPLRTALYPYRGKIAGMDDYEKILVERVAMSASDLPATVVRLPATYGEGDEQHRLALELRRMDAGASEVMLDERLAAWRWTRSYVENAAEAVVLAATDERASGRVYNVGDHTLSYADWVRAIGRAAGWQGEVVAVPTSELPERLRPPAGNYEQHLVADTTWIRDGLDYEPSVSLEEGLARTIAWERATSAR